MKNTIIESKELKFCLTICEDLDKIIEIENDKENSRFVYQWTKDRHIEAIKDENWMHITIKDKNNENIVGYMLLDGIKSKHDTIELTRIVISDKGKGYGRQTIKIVKKLCFEKLACHRLWLDVYDYNTKAIKLYKSEGFIQEGLLRDCKKIDNKYYSMGVFSMLKEEFELEKL